MSVHYPKVLIIGQYFEMSTGGGITMTNLFKGWNTENLAIAAERIVNPEWSACQNYYQLGYKEAKRRFPFYLWQKHEFSGVVTPQSQAAVSPPAAAGAESKKMKLYNRFLHYSGLYHYTRRMVESPSVTEWIKKFSPDIIYTQLASLELIEFVSSVSSKFNLPVIIHIMDDWPSTVSQQGILQKFWQKKIDREFRLLISKAKTLIGISDAMSREYLLRYGKPFIAFHNPINVDHWLSKTKTDYSSHQPFVILYAGRIGPGIERCFMDITLAIDTLVPQGLNIEFHLHSTSTSPILDEIRTYQFVKIKVPVPHAAMPQLCSQADVLLLPNDFDQESISFLRYSMPTKASEYMVSGTPILLYASLETAVTQHAAEHRWAYIVSENNTLKFADAIRTLYQNKQLREEIGTTARHYAVANYDDNVINEKFRLAFTSV